MNEMRRLLVDQNRLRNEIALDRVLVLNSKEYHYLHRVMRMRVRDLITIVDGKGNLWHANIEEKKKIRLTTRFDNPLQKELRVKPLICLAVSIPKRGFDDILQMSCEMGVDVIQPLISQRSVVKDNNSEKIIRWKKIICEAVEQSERLWIPDLRPVIKMKNWLNKFTEVKHIAFATTRIEGLKDCVGWLNELPSNTDQIWFAIGPEGGWNNEEESLAFGSGFEAVHMGETILRTSTAAVAACQLMISWRRTRSFLGK